MRRKNEGRLADGLAKHQRGDLKGAETIYGQILSVEPRNADAMHLLGVIALQRHDFPEALKRINQAIGINKRVAFFYNNLGQALRGLGRVEDALAAFQSALVLDAGHHDAIVNLGNAWRDVGKMTEARAMYLRGLAMHPGDVPTLNILGTLCSDEEQTADAAIMFSQAVSFDPRNYEAWNNLGLARLRQRRIGEGRTALEIGLRLAPENAVLFCNLGIALHSAGNLVGAEAAYRHSLEIDPSNADALANYGNLDREQGRLDKAAFRQDKAITLRPTQPEYYNNLGLTFQRAGLLRRAIHNFERALQHRPTGAQAWSNLGVALGHAGEIARAELAHQRAEVIRGDFATAGSNRLMMLHYSGETEPPRIALEHRLWGEKYARPFYPDKRIALHPTAGRKIRVGYVSADFRSHAVGYFIEPVLRAHDRNRFEVFAYSDVVVSDSQTEAFARMVDRWLPTAALSDDELAHQIRRDEIDILVDLAGHTARNRLLVFARAPAPKQITYLGYPNTTGLLSMDFRLTDAVADPIGQADHLHTERLLRLERCAWCYSPPSDAPTVGPLPALRRGFVTFGSFNNFAKISPKAVALWSEVLKAVPASRLLIKANPLADESICEAVWDQFQALGIERRRIELVAWESSYFDHLRRYSQVDLALDSFPYHGTTTTCEALWMGVPVITLAGRVHVSRVGASLLQAAGQAEFVARDIAGYVSLATFWARNLEKLAHIRASMRAQLTEEPLLDHVGHSRALEVAFESIVLQSEGASS